MTVRTNLPCPLHGVYGLEYHVLVFCLTYWKGWGIAFTALDIVWSRSWLERLPVLSETHVRA